MKRGGKYGVIRWDDKKPTSTNQHIEPDGPAPKGTAGTFHTHPNLGPDWVDNYSASPLDWDSAWGTPYPQYIISPNGVYRLANGSQAFLGPLNGGIGVVPWIALGVGVAGGMAAYCHFHGC